MVLTIQVLICLIVSFVLCSIGFKRFVWFMSVGYGIATAGIGAAMLIMILVNGSFNAMSIAMMLQCIVFIIYGFRLGGFLLIRELKNEAYRNKMKEVGGDMKPPIFVSIFMWVYCGCVYVCQAGGAVFRFSTFINNPEFSFNAIPLYIGVVISAIGVAIEAFSDKQKSAEKKTNPNMPAMHGLFKMCRCPNYFGEMLFWTGVFVSAFGGVSTVGGWILSVIGYVEIIFVMMSGAKRVETRHIKHYGDNPEYIAYADKTPLILPLIPLYHMTNPEKIAKEEQAKKEKAEKRASFKKGN